MTKEEFLKAFLPEYEKIFNEVMDYVNNKTVGNVDLSLIAAVNSSIFNHYFNEALEHYSRRQREICAETCWSETGDELMKWRVYEKIKQARKPQSYGI
jgi:hypothetical protein